MAWMPMKAAPAAFSKVMADKGTPETLPNANRKATVVTYKRGFVWRTLHGTDG